MDQSLEPARPSWLVLAALLACLASGCVIAADPYDPGASLTIQNHSSYVLKEVYVTPVASPNWGPNLVQDFLYPGEYVTAYGFPCGNYDALAVDETDLECALTNLRLCFSDGYWSVTDTTLNICAFQKRR